MSLESNARSSLEFVSDPGAGRSKWVAAGLLGLVVIWMGSGMVFSSDPAPTQQDTAEKHAVAVQVKLSEAELVTQRFMAKGQAQPYRDTQVRAQASGSIISVALENGAHVEKGDEIARIDDTQHQKAVAAAKEARDRAARELSNAKTLFDRGIATSDRVLEAEVDLAAAESSLTQALEALEDTILKAPFSGQLEALPIEIGEFIAAGEPAARVVDTTPLVVSIQAPQQFRNRLTVGEPAQVSFLTGETATGRIRFVGTAADPQTRTFVTEVEVANADGTIAAGVSAEVAIATGEVTAHFISPAILSLDEKGTLGVKTVDDNDQVVFHEVEISSAGSGGIWVTGLPDTARIIAVGQGFVTAGDKVTSQDADQ